MRGKSAILDGPDGAFVVAEANVPDPDPNGLLVRQELCGICGTDAYVYRGGLPGVTFPIVLGHETVGVVEQLGANIREDSTGRPLSSGDRVYIQPGMSCRQCLYCVVHQQPTLCLKRRGYGFRPLKDAPPDFQGGFSADVVFECTGVPASLPEGLDMLRRGGTYVEAGHYTDHGDVALNPFRHMVHKQVTLVAVWGADTPHFVAGRALIESGKYPFADLVSHRLPLHRVAEGVAAIGGPYRLDGEEIRKVAVAAHDA